MDCSTDKVCSNNKCVNPCPGTCATTAQCNVYNHIPICTCPEGTTGNAFVECHVFESKYYEIICHKSPFLKILISFLNCKIQSKFKPKHLYGLVS